MSTHFSPLRAKNQRLPELFCKLIYIKFIIDLKWLFATHTNIRLTRLNYPKVSRKQITRLYELFYRQSVWPMTLGEPTNNITDIEKTTNLFLIYWPVLFASFFFSSVRSSYSHPYQLLIHHPTFSDHTGPQHWTFTF